MPLLAHAQKAMNTPEQQAATQASVLQRGISELFRDWMSSGDKPLTLPEPFNPCAVEETFSHAGQVRTQITLNLQDVFRGDDEGIAKQVEYKERFAKWLVDNRIAPPPLNGTSLIGDSGNIEIRAPLGEVYEKFLSSRQPDAVRGTVAQQEREVREINTYLEKKKMAPRAAEDAAFAATPPTAQISVKSAQPLDPEKTAVVPSVRP